MGFFDFLKSKNKARQEEEIDANAFLLSYLKLHLEELGHTVTFSNKYAALEVNNELEIATAPMPGDFHPMMLPMMILTIHPTHFPEGIVSYLTGLGDSVETKVASLANEYIHDFFETLVMSLKEDTKANYSFSNTAAAEKVTWNVFTSNSVVQGEWETAPNEDIFFNILKATLETTPLPQKINSLKLYVSKQKSDQFAIECTLNNEQWDEGMELLKKYLSTWQGEVQYKALKQFMIIKQNS